MYGRVDWMMPVDQAILQLLAAPKPLRLSPNNIAANTGYSRSHVSRRCQVLVDHGLLEVERNGDPFFSVSELGQNAVDGQVDPRELEE